MNTVWLTNSRRWRTGERVRVATGRSLIGTNTHSATSHLNAWEIRDNAIKKKCTGIETTASNCIPIGERCIELVSGIYFEEKTNQP